jgi:hypothetical protein
VLQAREAVALTAEAVEVLRGVDFTERIEAVELRHLTGVVEKRDDAADVIGDDGVAAKIGVVV